MPENTEQPGNANPGTDDQQQEEDIGYEYATRNVKGVVHLDEFINSLLEFRKWLAEDGTVNPQVSFALHCVHGNCIKLREHIIHDVKDTGIKILDPCCDDRVIIDIYEKVPER
jgi:hypothetical protein